MKRFGNLYERICSWDNLELAARRARKRKRYRWYAENFELHRESVLREVRDELLGQRWQPAPYVTFRVYDPKERLICAAPYRDRIVQHAVCNIIAPLLERSFIGHTYSCRAGKGTGAARTHCRQLVKQYRYALKADVRKYFASIDHAILKAKLGRHIKCRPTLALLDRIIDSWQTTDQPPAWFADDDLLTPLARSRGLPIGALTSQLFANLYLSRIDHLIEEQLRPGGYARYTDDLVLFADSKRFLWDALDRLRAEFATERLQAHPVKSRVLACRDGVSFLGFRFGPDWTRVLPDNVRRFHRRLAALRRAVRAERRQLTRVWPAISGWFQFVREQPGSAGLVLAECQRQVF
ncbi:MAG: RNA-dependent DNA polymerase [Verrucomicrobia bacterium]|nr:RNA-dependent DNA polymerase [Verrucomicrobiota bacterium]